MGDNFDIRTKKLRAKPPLSVAIRLSPETTKQFFLAIEEAVTKRLGVSFVVKEGFHLGIDYPPDGEELKITAFAKQGSLVLSEVNMKGCRSRYDRIEFYLMARIPILTKIVRFLLQTMRKIKGVEK